MTVRNPRRLFPWLHRALARTPRHAVAARRPRLEELEGRDLPAAGVREQYALELINRMRAAPAPELSRLLNAGDPDVNNALTFFNVDRALLQQQWNGLVAVPPLAWNDSLASSALAHSQLMLQRDDQMHQFPGELDLLTRIQNAGYDAGRVAENIFAYGKTVFETHAAFAIDWGSGPGGIQNPPGHRDNYMDSRYTEIGIGLVDATAGKATGPLLTTQDFGARLNPGSPFLLGVVYKDANANSLYDLNEGLGGVTVTVVGNNINLFQQTAPGGGYQFALPAGNYTVTFSGGTLASPVTRQAAVGMANVKLDLNTQVAPQLQLSAAAYQARENAGSATITVTRGGDTASAVSVKVVTSDGTAHAGTDYTAVSATVNFAAGDTQKTVLIPLIDNTLPDGDRTVNLALSNATGGAQFGTPTQAVLTIQDDDQPGQLAFGAATFSAAENAGLATITVTRANGVRGAVSVSYATGTGTATAGADYTATSGALTFADGESSKTFTVALIDDDLVERPETVALALSVPTGGATLGATTAATLQIGDDDLPVVPSTSPPGNLIAAAQVFAHSREHYEDFVTKAYRRYLARTPDGSGLNYWATALQGGLTDESLEAGFLGSSEYIANHGGNGAGWVRGMYRDLLGRDPSQGEVDFWTGRLNAGVSTSQVAYGFAASAEREGQRVRDNYAAYLGRTPGDAEVQGWVNTFLRGFTNEDMIAGFVGSAEYYGNGQKGQGNAAFWVASAYRDVLFRDPHSGEERGWLRSLGFNP